MDRTLKVFFKVLLVIFFNETFYSRFVFLFFCRFTASLVSPFMGSWIFLGRISKLFFEISETDLDQELAVDSDLIEKLG